jgi:hypothetical protein
MTSAVEVVHVVVTVMRAEEERVNGEEDWKRMHVHTERIRLASKEGLVSVILVM